MADPSGEFEYDPQEVLVLFNSYECWWCWYDFIDELKTRLGDSYELREFGLETTTQKAFANDMKRKPVTTDPSSTVVMDQVTLSFGGGAQGDIVFMTVVRGDTRNWQTLTVEQIVSGLTHENQDADAWGWDYYNSAGQAEIKIAGLKPQTTFTVYSVTINQLTSFSYGSWSDVSAGQTFSTGLYEYEEEVEPEPEREESAQSLAFSALLLLMALFF